MDGPAEAPVTGAGVCRVNVLPRLSQGETLEELEENMKDASMLTALEDVPEEHEVTELALNV
jgi:hypothetical protein